MFSIRQIPKVILISLIFLAACSQNPTPSASKPLRLDGTGLAATYYSQPNFDGVRVAQTDRYINFDWQASVPARYLPAGEFSARWQADFRVPETGSYQFFLDALGNAQLFIEGDKVANGSSLKLKAGQSYDFVLEFVKTGDQAGLKLEWQFGQGARELIPQTSFYPGFKLSTLAVATGVNLLLNPSFTVDTGSWQLYGSGSKTSVSPGRDGTGKALEAAAWAWIQQDLPVSDIELGQSYTLKGYASAAAGQICTLGIAGGGSAGETFNQKLEFTGGWQEQGLVQIIPAGTAWMAVYLSSQDSSCRFDDLSLVAGESNPPPPVSTDEAIVSGGFEAGKDPWQQFGGSAVLTSDARVGSQALLLRDYSWLQQNIAVSRLEAGKTYTFSAFAKSQATCKVGLVLATDAAIVFNQTLDFSANPWQHAFLDLTIPANLSWAAVYVASESLDCVIDELSLLKQAPSLNPVANWTNDGYGGTGESLTVASSLDTLSGVIYGDIISYGQACSFKGTLFANLTGNIAAGSISGAEVDASVRLTMRDSFIDGQFSYSSGSCQGETRAFTLLKTSADIMLDAELRMLLFQNDVAPLTANFSLNANKVALGKLLFHDKELSGNRDISCATCHPASLGTTDHLALSIGTGGTGFGPNRVMGAGRLRVPRHAPDLFNRAFSDLMFWDGRVSGTTSTGFMTPAGAQLPTGLDSALAAQAMFPVITRAEMLGNAGDKDVFGAINELANLSEGNLTAMWSAIMTRLMRVPEYQTLFSQAYPGISTSAMGFEYAANAIAEYQKDAFTTLNSPFDRYLAGNDSALSLDQKQGALIFYGIGKCGSCHSGALLTDNSFHNIAVPQLGPGIGSTGLDFGRFNLTGQAQEQFAFKTPSLRNVTLTAPYMHNGAINNLVDAVAHYHLIEESLKNYDSSQLEPALQATVKNDTATLNQILATLDDKAKNLPLEGRAQSITSFLAALTDPAAGNLSGKVPASVPSGLPVLP
ncbi:MAG: carbohydrate binding domain-containing protein [Trueperaceae bacterium]|nr:carbohydrate binding domain-containing protein [Trueperaceae bacterium]